MSAPHKRREPLAGGSTAQSEYDTAKTKADPREVQGIRTKRNRTQPGPTWKPPAGWHAGALLDRLWQAPRRRRGRS